MNTKEKQYFFSGNEALSLAIIDCSLDLVTGYPGTPATEIIDNLIKKKDKKNNFPEAFWSVNEKVALEIAIGASFAGGRTLVTMKHVGVNVAADPLMTLSYTGVSGALIIVSCDDPGMFSSQNEQDNRNYAKFAKIPLLEPSDAQEVYDYLPIAINISEVYDTPVLFRMTTRISHSKSTLRRKTKTTIKKQLPLAPVKELKKNEDKYLMMPKQGRERHFFVEERLNKLTHYQKNSNLNHLEENSNNDKNLIVTSGISYYYLKENFSHKNILKLGMTYPISTHYIQSLEKKYKQIIVVEELDAFLEEQFILAQSQLKIKRKPQSFYIGEYSPSRVENLLKKQLENNKSFSEKKYEMFPSVSNVHPPSLCSGCPHLTIFSIFRKLNIHVTGDIGCYTIGALAPIHSLHSVIDMGASIPMALGARKIYESTYSSKVRKEEDLKLHNKKKKEILLNPYTKKPNPCIPNPSLDHLENKHKTIAVIGDSTFFHSGISGLLTAIQNHDYGVICILDNDTTAMTGRQKHPGSSIDETKKLSLNSDKKKINYVTLLNSLGVEKVTLIDPYRFSHCYEQVEKAIDEAYENKILHVLVLQRECALLPEVKQKKNDPYEVKASCVKCTDCLQIGCPSISFEQSLGHPIIDQNTCIGCGICADVCEYESIKKTLQTDE